MSKRVEPDPTEWLDENTRDRPPVFLEESVPADVLVALDRASMTSRTPGGIIVVHSPTDDPDSVKKALFWSIVQKTAEKYAPAVVERDSAVRLYTGQSNPMSEVRLRHTGRSRWRQNVLPGVTLRLEHGPVEDASYVDVGEARLPVERPERLLLSLPLNFLRDEVDLADLLIWLKSLILAKQSLVDAYRDSPRPVVLKRIANLARDVGNERLANLLDEVVAEEQSVRISRARTGVGTTFVVPHTIARLQSTRSPWLDRLRLTIRESVTQTRPVFEDLHASARRRELAKLLESARGAKAHDAYHSSSIEGYRLRLDEVSAFLTGRGGSGPGIEDLEARLAIVGYSNAFDVLLQRLADQEGVVPLTPGLTLDLYADLFTPSIEAGLVEPDALRRFRSGPVFIRDTLYTPPNADKVPGMLDLLFDEIEAIPEDEGYSRATLVHLWFVWIHPFPDGNGRLARFLMNTALLANGRSWLTIRVDQRGEYFASVKRAQLEDDYSQFAHFIRRCVESERENEGAIDRR
jgi:Fic family protein